MSEQDSDRTAAAVQARRAAAVQARRAGATWREIAERFGYASPGSASGSLPSAARRDADAKALRRQPDRPCVVCGALSTRKTCSNSCRAQLRRLRLGGNCSECGSGPLVPDNVTGLCQRCLQRRVNAETTRSHIAAARRFAERYGRPPAATDWNPRKAREIGHLARAERFHRDGDYPYVTSIVQTWGSWNAFIRAAGFEPRGLGDYPRDPGHGGLHLAAERERGWRPKGRYE